MGFETPNFNEQAESEKSAPEISEKKKPAGKFKKLKRIAGAIALGAALLSAEGCKPENEGEKMPPKGPDPIAHKENTGMQAEMARERNLIWLWQRR